MINGSVGIGALEFGVIGFFYANAIVTSIGLLSLFCYAENNNFEIKWLAYFGVDSIVVLCTNNLLIEIIRLLDYKLSGNFLLEHGMFGCIIFTILLLILEYGIIRISQNKYIGFLFGKKRC